MTSETILDTLRQNEAQARWLTYLEGLGGPAVPIELPDDDETVRLLHAFGVQEADMPAILAGRPDPKRNPELWWLLERSVMELVSTMGRVEPPPWFPSPRAVPGMDPFFFVHVFIATLPYTRRYHREHGIPDEVARATLADLGRNIRVNRKRYGDGGLEVSHWLMLHFRGAIYQLGRLQFERARLGNRIAEAARACGHDADPDDIALSVHIPDFMGPMTPEACDASFAMARDFFPAHFPDEEVKWAICSSWLLDPHLKDYLPETSNIIQFQDRFHVGSSDTDADALVLKFVFGPAPEDLDSLPQQSSLQRAVVTHLKNGGHWRFYPGWFPWD